MRISGPSYFLNLYKPLVVIVGGVCQNEYIYNGGTLPVHSVVFTTNVDPSPSIYRPLPPPSLQKVEGKTWKLERNTLTYRTEFLLVGLGQ